MLYRRYAPLLIAIVIACVLGATAAEAKKPDNTPPDPVSGLTVDTSATTHQSITLDWTATGDDGSQGQATTYIVRYDLDGPITEAKWDSEPLNRATAFTDPYAIPHPDLLVVPAESGEAESVEFAGLAAGTTYYFGIKACDEAGNCSTVADADGEMTDTADAGEWSIDIVNEQAWIDKGHRKDVDVTADGQVGVWYADEGDFYHSYRPSGEPWEHDVYAGGVDDKCLAFKYSPTGVQWATTCVNGSVQAMYLDTQTGWITETVYTDMWHGPVTLEFEPGSGEPAISFRGDTTESANKLVYASRNSGIWTTEVVDSGFWVISPSMIFDPDLGHPMIAYAGRVGDDYEILFAEKPGASWVVEQLDSGSSDHFAGGGVHLAYHPVEQDPAVAYWDGDNEGLHYTYRTSSGWAEPQMLDVVDSADTGGHDYLYGDVALAFGADGTAYAMYEGNAYYRATRIFADDGTGWQLVFSEAVVPADTDAMILNDSANDANNGMPVFTYGWDPIRIIQRVPPDPGVSVGPKEGLETTEAGGQATFRVRLDAEPAANVTIALSSSDTSEGTVSPTSLTFTPSDWNLVQTVTVTGVDDSDVDGDVLYSVVTGAASSSDPDYDGVDVDDVYVTSLDDDISVLYSHIGDLDGEAISAGSKWQARIAVTVHDGDHDPIAGATVDGMWIAGVSGSASCTTDASGTCTVTSAKVKKSGVSTIVFEVADVSHASYAYDSSANHDPDGDSDGTTISVDMP